ncbi:hypothetical protein PHJA_002720300 [Phtheirospermum japonicum]|uniref:Uncharacterized protein n=1 Tax=Phtheirospermum japonicum TaxID=374723 RepID=A0A830DIB1_9LAMI|nr:hypothetical protein PHJA_002720300 [Phtheirospermum japonicum]
MQHPPPDSDLPPLAAIKVRSSSPRFPPPTTPLHCVCPVVVVRYPDDKDSAGEIGEPVVSVASAAEDEEEPEYHDATDDRKAMNVMNYEFEIVPDHSGINR